MVIEENYSKIRRIWRIIYPPVMFILVQVVVMAIGGVILYNRSEAFGQYGYNPIFQQEIVEAIMRTLLENTMRIQIAINIVSISVFLPIWKRADSRNEPHRIDNPVYTGIFVAGFFATFNMVQMLIFGLLDITKYFASYEELASMLVTDNLFVQIIAIGITAPIVEELVFRGILMSRMKWMPGWLSVFVQAFLFGLVHLNLFQSLYAFIAGLMLGILFLKYKSIVMVIIGHMAYNLISVIASSFESEILIGALATVSVILLPFCFIALKRNPGARKLLTEHDLMPSPAIITPPSAGMPADLSGESSETIASELSDQIATIVSELAETIKMKNSDITNDKQDDS